MQEEAPQVQSTPEDDTGWQDPGMTQTTDHSHFAQDLDDPEPAWDLTEVGTQLEAALSGGMPNPVHLEARYTELLFEHGNMECPGGHGDGDDFFHLFCTTEEGYTFEGIALRSRKEIVDIGVALQQWSLSGDFSIGYPADTYGEGQMLKGAGGLSSHGETQDEAMQWWMSWNGSWSDSATEGWLAKGVSLLMSYEGGVTTDNRRYLTATGGLAIGQTDLYLDEVRWDESGPCLGKTTGDLSIREPSGHWYTWSLGDDCDGCGEVVFSDSLDMGELCLDLSTLEETASDLVPGKYTVVVPDTGTPADTGGG